MVKSWKFSNFPKIDFFWLERLQNWSKRSSRPKFLYKTLKSAKFGDFWGFLADLAVFDHIWKCANKSGSVVAKSRFYCWIIKFIFGNPPGKPEFHGKLFKIWNGSRPHFLKFFTQKNFIIFVPKKCKNALAVSLMSSLHVSSIAWIVTRQYRTLLGYLGLLKQVKFTSKYSDNFDQNEIITMMNNVDGILM